MSNAVRQGGILGLGNPLLDVSAIVDDDLLKKYEMEPNNAILAGDKHRDLCKDMAANFKVDYIAGGAIQNSMRVAQWFFDKPNVCTFFGAIGQDDFGKQMTQKAKEDRVNVVYMIIPDVPTGTCACLITDQGKNRSLCAYLGASQKFSIEHVRENVQFVDRAKLFYTSGFHLIVSLDSALFLAEAAHKSPDKKFVMNLSAPYISQFYSKQLLTMMPYTDILFGNESEAQAFADVVNWKTTDLEVIAQKLADYEHKRKRMVVITQGKDDILIAFTGANEKFRRFPVTVLSDDEIVDTNGAGDSFVGGFLAYAFMDKSLEECVNAGIYAATEIIKMSGCTLPTVNKHRLS